MACGQVMQPPRMDDRYGPLQRPFQPAFFPQHNPAMARPSLGRPPLPPPRRRFAQGAPTQPYNGAPPTRQGFKRKRGGKNNKKNKSRLGPRPPAERAETPTTVPLTAPHAPYNNNSFLMRREDEASVDGERPQGEGCYPTLDGDAAELGAQLDFFGTGMDTGLLADYRSDSESGSEEEEEEDDDWSTASASGGGGAGAAMDAEAAEERALRKLPEPLRRRLAAEKLRLESLEDENLELRERLSLAELEIADLKAKQRAAEAPMPVAPAVQMTADASAPVDLDQ